MLFTKLELELEIKEIARAYFQDFHIENRMDSNWLETAYSDLSAETEVAIPDFDEFSKQVEFEYRKICMGGGCGYPRIKSLV